MDDRALKSALYSRARHHRVTRRDLLDALCEICGISHPAEVRHIEIHYLQAFTWYVKECKLFLVSDREKESWAA